MDWINYRLFADKEIISSLYADYTTHFEKVAEYYAGSYLSTDAVTRKLHLLQKQHYHRALLHRILNEQNREYHSGIKTLANIDLLANDNTFAVVTGQQLGLFTGPLYTIYKAITTVKLAEKLTIEFPDYNFVPVFWLEGEDHDLEEINKVKFINSTNEFTAIEYLPANKTQEKNLTATGSLLVDSSIEEFLSKIANALPQTEYRPALTDAMRGYYKEGTSLLHAFAGFFNHIYEDSGLIFLNSNHPEFKKLLSPLFQKEIESNSETSKLVIQKSAELEEHYHAQIKAKAINLFMLYKGGRYLIEPSESGDYFLRNTRKRFTKEELLTIVSTTPELISPNVVLRPLCQDTLLPTIEYVAGPSEIAYFAQLKPVYEFFHVVMPIIYPRASITIIEEKVQKVLEKYSLDFIDLFDDIDALLVKVSEQVSEVKIDALFSSLETKIKEAINEARFGIQQIDPTLNGTIDSTLQKIQQYLEVLKQKTQKAQQQKEEISLKQIRKAALHIFPNGNFQEREFSVIQYLNKYGPDFVKWISHEIVIDKFQHQVIPI